ncbi:MAG: exodeoxyribonuclease VII small subunit [Prevotellaceae bacterium]|jgi:exodeoxyribonuclease VII small subunit|nr:exodeoxyribonuclease VII small subunit [Prevotellaceae bacterium]
MQKNLTYQQAVEQLEAIVAGIENHSLGVDDLMEQVKQATELANFCRQQLRVADKRIEQLLSENDR